MVEATGTFSLVERVRKAISGTGQEKLDTKQGRFDGAWKELGDLAIEPQRNAVLIIVIRRSAIDDHIRYSAICGQQRKGGSGMNRERGSKRNH